MGTADYGLLAWEGIQFLTFLVICAVLMEDRFPRRTAALVRAGFLAAELVIQACLFFAGEGCALVLPLIALTAYLPAIICLHILSKNGFFQTCVVWMSGMLAAFSLNCLRRLITVLAGREGMGTWVGVVSLAAALPAAAGLAALAWRIRRPFRECVREYSGRWLPIMLPTGMVFLVFSYFESNTAEPVALLLIFLAVLSVLLVAGRLIFLSASITRMREMEREAARQLEVQRKDYEAMRKKIELGRAYRHDMRHHLSTLDGLLRQGEEDSARQYISSLSGRLTELEEVWCANAAVNAVLSAHIGEAERQGCQVEVDVRVPGELPFDETDLCVIFANTLENAVHACCSIPEGGQRRIGLSARLNDSRRLTVSVWNSCPWPVELNEEGIPAAVPRDGHGYGLRNVQAVVKKYNGLLQCRWEDGQFQVNAVLFDSQKKGAQGRKRTEWPAVVVTVLGLLFCVVNCLPLAAQAAETVPILGAVVRAVNLHTYAREWGERFPDMKQPGNEMIETELWDAFLVYAADKYSGYTDMDVGYTVTRDDELLRTVRFDAVIYAGGSGQLIRWVTWDKAQGRVLELSGLFLGDSYIEVISAEVLDQMIRLTQTGEGSYFIPGEGWAERDVFRSIAPNQNFYINGENQLVIVFDEYQVGPGSMGTPEFVIPTQALAGILVQPSILA